MSSALNQPRDISHCESYPGHLMTRRHMACSDGMYSPPRKAVIARPWPFRAAERNSDRVNYVTSTHRDVYHPVDAEFVG